MMAEGGHKRACAPSDTAPKCISHSGVQNFTYPRTGKFLTFERNMRKTNQKKKKDAVVITCIIHPNGDKILLGRQSRWPKKMFSCISGTLKKQY